MPSTFWSCRPASVHLPTPPPCTHINSEKVPSKILRSFDIITRTDGQNQRGQSTGKAEGFARKAKIVCIKKKRKENLEEKEKARESEKN